MAQYEQRDNSGALFRNEKKTEAKHPDYQGDCLVNGVKMRMSAWLKEGKSGKFFSFSFSEPYVSEPVKTNKPEDIESDIPF